MPKGNGQLIPHRLQKNSTKLNELISFTLPGGSSNADAIRKIVKDLDLKLDEMPKAFENPLFRGKVFFGELHDVLDRITFACPQDDGNRLSWTLTGNVLQFGTDLPLVNRGGRPRKDSERRRIKELREMHMTWKEIAEALNRELHQSKTADAYRRLLKRS